MARDKREAPGLDRELEDLAPELRWREWMRRIEAVLFASATPVARDDLARVATGLKLDASQQAAFDTGIASIRQSQAARQAAPQAGGGSSLFGGGRGGPARADGRLRHPRFAHRR